MTRSDSMVIILVLILLYYSYSWFWNFEDNSNKLYQTNYAEITITGAAQQKILLNQDKKINIAGRIGTATIQIKNNKIRFLHSPCRKKYCIHSGWLAKVGSIAACIPNGIMISIKSTKNVFDAINY